MADKGLSETQRQALHWLTRLRDQASSEQEQQAFAIWLAQSPDHVHAYAEAIQFWEQLNALPDAAGKRLTAARQYAQRSRRRAQINLLTILVLLGALVSQYPSLERFTARSIHTAKGESRSLQLADGSVIQLNTDSRIRVTERLGQRKIWLEQGEAWFDVRHRSDQAFEVIVGDTSIRDLGTQFNILKDSGSTTVSVSEGEVAIEMPGQAAILVKAGQQSIFDEHGHIEHLASGDLDNASAWRSGIMVFKHRPLREVLQQLSRYHQVEFDLQDPQLAQLSVSGRFSTRDLNESLNTLSNALQVKVTRLSNAHLAITLKK